MKKIIVLDTENISYNLVSDVLLINGAQSPNAEKFYDTVRYTSNTLRTEFITLFREFFTERPELINPPATIGDVLDIFTSYLLNK